MTISLANQSAVDATLPPTRVKVFTGSALPLEIEDIPDQMAGGTVEGVSVAVTNADGVTVTGSAKRVGSRWLVLFAASSFSTYGTVDKGVRIEVTVKREDNSTAVVILGVADLVVKPSVAASQPGDPSKHYQVKGGDEYYKSVKVGEVQHFKKVTIAYDAQMGDWGFNLTGDYILNSNGEFVPFIAEV